MRQLLVSLLLCILVLMPYTASSLQSVDARASIQDQVTEVRIVPLMIKVVFIGFQPNLLDTAYMTWKENLPVEKVNSILMNGTNTGVTFDLTYRYTFVSKDYGDKFVNYTQTTGGIRKAINPWWGESVDNAVYDANKVERWLYDHPEGYGGMPESGDVFFIANLTRLPSVSLKQMDLPGLYSPTPHYYNVSYVDWDRDFRFRYRDFMIAWGGNHRSWFLDLSAGPDFWSWYYDPVPHVPIQVAAELFKIDFSKNFGRKWLAEFVSNYISEAVSNLAVPHFVYKPRLASQYDIKINLIDNRSAAERDEVPTDGTVNVEWIRRSFQDLLPYSTINVDLNIRYTEDYPDLRNLISSYTYLPPKILESQITPFIDLRPVYKYLQEHLSEFDVTVSDNADRVTIPVFAFALSGKTRFGFTEKWYVADEMTQLKTERAASEITQRWNVPAAALPDRRFLLCVALGDIAIIGVSQYDFELGNHVSPQQANKGIGFTQSIIHEVGHMFGLPHPHEFGSLGDFVKSPMGYFVWEYSFGQFDKDALQRAHADQVMLETSALLHEARLVSSSKLMLSQVNKALQESQELLSQAEEDYTRMNYAGSISEALQAVALARFGLQQTETQPEAIGAWTLLGIIIGSAMMYMTLRLTPAGRSARRIRRAFRSSGARRPGARSRTRPRRRRAV